MLRLAGWLYGRIADIRNAFYDRGTLRAHDLGATTVSVGNITAGGTGKTPLVAYIAEMLSDGGKKVCILTRGYGRKRSGRVLVSDWSSVLVDAAEGGDEPVELARKLIGKAIVVADADRVAAARWARKEFQVTAFVLDDGFQHRRVKRNLDIVCIDAANPFGGGAVLPAGTLREPLVNLHRADVFVITRIELVDDLSLLREQIAELNPHASIFLSTSRISNAGEIDRPAFAFCGLGNPSAFFELLRQNECSVRGTRTFPDHHEYTQDDMTRLHREAGDAGAEILVTTAKDVVKLEKFELAMPIRVAELRMEIDRPDEFRRLITS